jgi:hypothetical protein
MGQVRDGIDTASKEQEHDMATRQARKHEGIHEMWTANAISDRVAEDGGH